MANTGIEQRPFSPAPVRNALLSEAKLRLINQRLRGVGTTSALDQVLPRPPGASVPLSAEQRRIWLHASTDPTAAMYNEPFTIHREGSFDRSILKASLDRVLERHEIWRTSFSRDGFQIVHESCQVALPLLDLSTFSLGERQRKAAAIADEEARKSFSLSHGPLFRAHVVKMAEQEHCLYLTFHHIVFDGISITRTFLPELIATYNALEQGTTHPLAAPTLQYGDYAVWCQSQNESPQSARHLSYWKKQLGGELSVLCLPQDRPRKASSGHRGSTHVFTIPKALLDRLRQLGRLNQISLYTLFLAAFKVLLFRYSGQQDLVLGSVTDGRRRPELFDMIGNFLETFAIRTRPHPDTPFTDFLTQTQNAVFGALAASDVSFDEVVKAINPPRLPGQHPIFNTFFSVRPPMPALPRGWRLTHNDANAGSTKFDLYLELGETSEGMEGRFAYNSDLWNAGSIERMAAHWLVLLESICDNPEFRLGQLEILTRQEKASLFRSGGWNDTAHPVPQATLSMLIASQVARQSDSPAVSFRNQLLTYQQLHTRSLFLASLLRHAGAGPGHLVAIGLDRSFDLIAGLLAILHTGAAYLPIDITLPDARVFLCLEDAKPSVILTSCDYAEKLAWKAANLVLADQTANSAQLYDGLLSDMKTPEAHPGQATGALEGAAYTIYTSGTSGEPKGVEISQRSLVNLLQSMQLTLGLGHNDVLLAITPVSFDIAALELFLPLITGGTVVIATREETQDPQRLAALIEHSACTVMQATPTTWRTLLLSGWNPRAQNPSQRPALRTILCGGEVMSRELADRLLATGAEVWNMYGPTETTIWSLMHRVSTVHEPGDNTVPVGLPIRNTTAYILDSHLQQVPIGVPGELYLGGTGLATQYVNQPQKTAEKFLGIPSAGGKRLYGTGDLARRSPDGTIQIAGRTDNQVKIRGFRIELEAVEAAVLRHPQVAAAAARTWPEATGGYRLSVYVVPIANRSAPTASELRSFLEQSVADSMIPSDVTALETIPSTSHGKIDRAKLPPPHHDPSLPAHFMPDTVLESSIKAIWADLLGISSFSLDDNFFDLGGHSVLAASLQQHLLARLDRRVSMVELFQYVTVRQQAELLLYEVTPDHLRSLGVLALQTEGTRTSIFWMHDLNGNIARVIGNKHPFYSVEFTVDDIVELGDLPALENIARCHVAKILKTQPTGPFILGGLCIWGIPSYEIASQLRAAGHEVSLLVMLDAPNPATQKSLESVRLRANFLFYLMARALRLGVRTSLSRVQERFRQYRSFRSAKTSPKTEMATLRQTIETAAIDYKPPPYSGEVLLILASDHPPHLNYMSGWQAAIPNRLHARYVEGHHRDLTHPNNVQAVAEKILSHLNEVPHSAPASGFTETTRSAQHS